MEQLQKANTLTLYNLYLQKKGVKDTLTYNEFKRVTDNFNKKISNKIFHGYKFSPFPSLGIFNIIMQHRTRKSTKANDINWGETNKRKKELESLGILLYKEWWELNGVEVPKKTDNAEKKTNGGTPYIIYHTDSYFYTWNWYKTKSTEFVKNISKYKFVATRKNKREPVNIIKADILPEITYGLHK